MSTILGVAGSLRTGSHNGALLRAAAEVAPDGVSIEIATIDGIPLYNRDREAADGLPEPVSALKERIVGSDALLLVTPEYNNSIPGVFKNAVDWLSRPGKDIPRVFGGKPVGLIGASTGRGGTRMAQSAWLPVLRVLGAQVWSGRQYYVVDAARAFDGAGKLVDEALRERLTRYVAGFAEFVGR